MSLSDMLKKPLRRLNPYRGLVIDVPTWAAAHDYHRMQQQVHAMAMHQPGVVVGLEVVAWNPPDNSLVIYPGMAVDGEGHTIILGEPQRFHLQTREKGIAYIVLQYREVPQEMTNTPGEDQPQPQYTLEAYRLEERRQVPQEAYIELARIQISGKGAPISDAENLWEPKPDEIDLRYRRVSGPRPLGEVAVGVVPLEATADGAPRHQLGGLNLVRTINATTGYHAEFKGSIPLNQEIRDCHLLFMAGQQEFPFEEAWQGILLNFVERGGVLVGEACGAGITGTKEAVPFRQSFRRLAERLKRKLAPVDKGHPLLNAYHLFAEPPHGIDGPALMVAGDGIVYSDGDYGCLWDGGRPEKPNSREAIRSAIELGVNLGVYASQRAHLHSIKMVAQ